ncbi:hypothetical protein Aab01nite_63750 [Paractinoplanes abujensis]|uniref:Uncharacterized protein n=1 Tax=Paractinoplanes abujensis TaxID=882441 RepID=A0A7W7CQ67_9ACTN|nr:hypothetical protein [Actinoplanes abujensis]MBB4692715.1 hypothetical protein [Actinoplanes abujensis]GID22785.1 hypothetical protein Aab01nite_63750 [Actinoplanes abujensis]
MTVHLRGRTAIADRPADGALDHLRTMIQALPVPTAPLTFPSREAALGLALMDLSFRLDHVPRLSEHLTLMDRGHMSRTISVDVDLDLISGRLRDTLLVPGDPERDGPPSLWVPVSRYSRRDLAPVTIRDSNGEVVPRLSHRDANRVTAAAFVKLLSMLINAHDDVSAQASPIHRLRHTHQRSRWLIEAAITELIMVGAPAGSRLHTPLDHADLLDAAGGGSRAVRDLALLGLDDLFAAGGGEVPFARLLQLAIRQHVLVAQLGLGRPRRFLTWDAPLLPAQHRPAPLQSLAKNVLPVNREFVVEYETEIPRSVKAYHLTLETRQEISVRRFLMSSDVDEEFVEVLAQDLESVARRTEALGRHHKLLELEMQSIASRLAELGRRRLVDLAGYEAYLARLPIPVGPGSAPPPRPLTAQQVVDALTAGNCSLEVLAAFCAHYASDGLQHLARSELAGPALRAIAAGLRSAQVGRDITCDNDPREYGAHANWRRPSVELSPQSTEPVRVFAFMTLADEAPALIESITRMVAGLALVVLGIGTLLSGGVTWLYSPAIPQDFVPEQADAVVAVLLLVPGLLLARLDLPSTKSVLGQLHKFQRTLAAASVVVTTALAVVVGTVDSDREMTRLFQLALAVLIGILICCLCEFSARRIHRSSPVPRSTKIPRWLRDTRRATRPPIEPDDFFDARGEV